METLVGMFILQAMEEGLGVGSFTSLRGDSCIQPVVGTSELMTQLPTQRLNYENRSNGTGALTGCEHTNDGHLGCFCALATLNRAAMNMNEHVSL